MKRKANTTESRRHRRGCPRPSREAARLFALSLLLGGCMVGPDFEKPRYPDPPIWARNDAGTSSSSPQAISRPVATPIDVTWWKQFKDPVLTSLEQRAASKNLSIRAAALQLAESRAQRGIAGADQFPMLRGNGSYTRESPSKEGILSLTGFGGNGDAASGVGAGTIANGLGIGVLGIPAAEIKPFNLWQYGVGHVLGNGLVGARPTRCRSRRFPRRRGRRTAPRPDGLDSGGGGEGLH